MLWSRLFLPENSSKSVSCSIVSSSLPPHGLFPARLLCPWNYPGEIHSFLQGIFLTQGSILYSLHWQVDSYSLSHLGIPLFHSVVTYSFRLGSNEIFPFVILCTYSIWHLSITMSLTLTSSYCVINSHWRWMLRFYNLTFQCISTILFLTPSRNLFFTRCSI